MKKFEDLYLEFYFDSYRMALYYTKNEQEAKDLLQNTWLRVLRHFEKYDQNKKFEAWLFSILKNTYKTSISNSKSSEINNYIEDNVLVGISSRDEESFLIKKEIEPVMKRLKKHNPLYFEIIIRRFFKNQSYKQISDGLNIPLGSAKSKVFYALKQLKRMIDSP